MKKIMMSWKLVVCILHFLILPDLYLIAEDRVVVSLNGTYDLDGDGMSEFLSIEKQEQQTKFPQTIAYYEIDDDGLHTKIWSTTTQSPIKDVRIVDMDGNGSPEVLLLTENASPGVGQEPAWIYLFPWETASFSSLPVAGWGEEKGGGHKPSGLTEIDINNDGRDEVAVAMGSPGREIILLQLNFALDPPLLEVYQRFSSPSLSSGYGQISVSAVDHNRDGFTDLVATSKEFSSLKVHVFVNEGGDLVEGPFFLNDLALLDRELSGLIPGGINTVDIDQDGVNEVLLPFRTGQAIALNINNDGVTLEPATIEVASLFSLPEQSIDNTVVNDILLERAKLGITEKKVLRKIELETTEDQPPAPPEGAEGLVEGVPEAEIPVKRVRQIELTTVEAVDLEPPVLDVEVARAGEPLTEEGDLTAEPAQPKRVRQVELTALAKDDEEAVPSEEVEPLEPAKTIVVIPEGIDISDTVIAGEKYVYSLEKDGGRRLHAFRPKVLPEGAFFDPPAHAVTWTPTENQIGVHRLAYEVEYELSGENVDVQEVEGVGVQILTTTETDTVEVYLLVRRAEEP